MDRHARQCYDATIVNHEGFILHIHCWKLRGHKGKHQGYWHENLTGVNIDRQVINVEWSDGEKAKRVWGENMAFGGW